MYTVLSPRITYMPQVTTSSEAGPGTKIIYCIIIHICLWWNLYMRMDNSLVHFIRVAGGTFRRWFYPDNPPASSLIFKWYRCSSSLPLIGWRAGGRYGPWLGNTRRGDRRMWQRFYYYYLKCLFSSKRHFTLCFMEQHCAHTTVFVYPGRHKCI